MGDFVYHGDHSITFQFTEKVGDDVKVKSKYNTWTNWHMAPKSRPFVVAPSVKEQYVDVPAADGMLDYTDILAGKARYSDRIGQWEFIVDYDLDYPKWYDMYTDILTRLHGRYVNRIILDDDPKYYWRGRLTVQGQFGNKDYNGITIGYHLSPYKYPVDSKVPSWWAWNDLFSNTIEYGSFQVNGWKARNIINSKDDVEIANIEVTYNMSAVRYDGSETMQYNMFINGVDSHPSDFSGYQRLTTGSNSVTLYPGDNYFLFIGNGTVTVEYERGKVL